MFSDGSCFLSCYSGLGLKHVGQLCILTFSYALVFTIHTISQTYQYFLKGVFSFILCFWLFVQQQRVKLIARRLKVETLLTVGWVCAEKRYQATRALLPPTSRGRKRPSPGPPPSAFSCCGAAKRSAWLSRESWPWPFHPPDKHVLLWNS